MSLSLPSSSLRSVITRRDRVIQFFYYHQLSSIEHLPLCLTPTTLFPYFPRPLRGEEKGEGNKALIVRARRELYEAQQSISALIVLIDDVHNIKAKRFFTTLKNTLSDTKIIDSTRVLFVLSSTIEEWKPFMKTNHPIGRFFIPRVELRNLDKTSTVSLVKKIIKNTGVVFTDNIISKIYSYTNGHLFQIHSLGMALYNNEINGKVGDREWSRGFEEALSYLGGIIYEGQIQTMSGNEVKVYRSMNAFRRNNIGSIRKKIRIKGLNEYLRRLVEKRFLTVPKRGEYVILDKMLWEYLQRK